MSNRVTIFCHLFIFIFCLQYVQAQDPSTSAAQPSIQSPDVSTLGKFGSIPISPFTGAALIKVPLLEIPVGSGKIPVYLAYDASGCRPDQRPSVFGLNWSLGAGGAIQRRAKGAFDERYNKIFARGVFSYTESGTRENAKSDWNTEAQLRGKDIDQAPDEFVFNFNGIAGSFYLNHENNWIVNCKDDPNIKVEVKTETDYKLGIATLGRVYTGFTLTMGNGIKYSFGYDLEAIEFSSPSVPAYMPPGWSRETPPFANNSSWEASVQTSAWQLTKIIYPDGNTSALKYKRGYAPYMPLYSEISEGAVVHMPVGVYMLVNRNQPQNYSVLTSTLIQINTSQGVVCDFESSLTKDLFLCLQ